MRASCTVDRSATRVPGVRRAGLSPPEPTPYIQDMSDRLITWKTRKSSTGYQWRVYEVPDNAPVVVLKSGTATTRGKASTRAKSWAEFLKRNPNYKP